jgi:hypothetical protein
MRAVHLLLVGSILPALAAGTVILSLGSSLDRRGTLPSQAVVDNGEVLTYEVRWTFFKLGSITIHTRRNYTAEAHVDSYEGVPFVDLHSIHYTTMDSFFFSRGCRSVEKQDDGWKGLEYVYDLPGRTLTVEETTLKDPSAAPSSRKPVGSVSLRDTSFLDGVSIAYFPRMFVHTNRTVEVPTVLYGKIGMTTFYFTNNKTTEKIDAVDSPVRLIEVEGTTTVQGIYGMTGDFRGWFSDDSAAVPIKGRLKVLLGEVEVELIQWNRKGWNPPTE